SAMPLKSSRPAWNLSAYACVFFGSSLMDRNRLNELIARYKDGTLTQEEKALLDTWYLQLSQQPEPSISERDLQHHLDVIWGDLEINRVQRSRYRRFIAYFSVAALLILGLGFYFNKNNQEEIANKISQ